MAELTISIGGEALKKLLQLAVAGGRPTLKPRCWCFEG